MWEEEDTNTKYTQTVTIKQQNKEETNFEIFKTTSLLQIFEGWPW